MKTGMHTPACWTSPDFCICPPLQVRTISVGLVPEKLALPGHRIIPGGPTAGAVKAATIPMVAYQEQVRRNNELIQQVALWKHTASWAAGLGFACMVITAAKALGWF